MSDGRSRKSGEKYKKLQKNMEKRTVKKTHLYKNAYISKFKPIQNTTEKNNLPNQS